MKFSHAAVICAMAAQPIYATTEFNPRIVTNLRQQLSQVNFNDANSLAYLKFYADNFLWSITELYKGFKGMYYDVAALRKELSKQDDKIDDLEDELDDYDDRIDDLEDAIKDLEDLVEAQKEQLDQLKEDVDNMSNDQFFDDTFDGSGSGPWVAADVVDQMKEQMGFDDMSSIDQMMAGMHLDQVEDLIENFDSSADDFDSFKDDLKDHFDEAAGFQYIRDEEQQQLAE